MSYLTQWRLTPFVVVTAAVVVWHEIGLAHLARRSSPAHRARRRRRSLYFYAGLAVMLVGVASPMDYWGYRYFFDHMVQHIVLMFFAPTLIVIGAPWLPLVHALPVGLRRRVGRAVYLGPRSPMWRTLGRWLTGGAVAVVAFNVVMVFWHLPGPFDFGDNSRLAHVWLMHGSYIVAGVLFWAQILPSYPFRPRLSTGGKISALVGTNLVMLVLAMAMSIFTAHSWYSVYAHVPGVQLGAFADQQIGAGILWVCGDFWALPALVWVVRRAVEAEGSAGSLVDRLLESGAMSALRELPRD